MQPARYPRFERTGVFLLVMVGLVHVSLSEITYAQRKAVPAAPPPAAKSVPQGAPAAVRYGMEGLPQPVIEMREAIQAAVRSGRIEELKVAIELNEMKPAFGEGAVGDPIAWLRQSSGDGEGREVLAALANILDAGYVTLPLGRDVENSKVYIWPHFAETGVANLTPEREVELLRLVPPASAKAMRESGRYTYWSLGIGADGVWHFLRK
ncbi:MAG: hypothetical protein ACKVP7_01440 [Hyphomicrobiaceae bacterium]